MPDFSGERVESQVLKAVWEDYTHSEGPQWQISTLLIFIHFSGLISNSHMLSRFYAVENYPIAFKCSIRLIMGSYSTGIDGRAYPKDFFPLATGAWPSTPSIIRHSNVLTVESYYCDE